MLQQMETYILELIWGGTINIITNWPCFVSFENVQKLRKDNSELKLVFFSFSLRQFRRLEKTSKFCPIRIKLKDSK